VIHWRNNPTVYEINTWIWLNELSEATGRPVTLGSVPQAELRRLARLGFDGLWLMGVWQRSPRGQRIARDHPELQDEYERALPDYTPADVVGSPYAVYDYHVDPALGGDDELDALRKRLAQLDLRLILDFVPNHLAVDHPWVTEHPERLVQGREQDLDEAPDDFFRAHGRILAHGRDPYFAGWTDTVQLDYRRPETRQAMADVLLGLAARCDGVRCDMAMLVTREVFTRTWGGRFEPLGTEFWPDAIQLAKEAYPGFLTIAEVYWDLEYELQRMGFDYTYDKRLYDRLRGQNPTLVREHIELASVDYQRHLVRFVENHDEERAVTAFGAEKGRAVATLALTLLGLRLFHQGQLDGSRVRLPVQLGRRPPEPIDPATGAFYDSLLAALDHPALHVGQWQVLEPVEPWPGCTDQRNIVAHLWSLGGEHRLIVANLSSDPASCRLWLPLPEMAGATYQFEDLLSPVRYRKDGEDLLDRGLCLDLPGYGCHLFAF
jgi:glycosidase